MLVLFFVPSSSFSFAFELLESKSELPTGLRGLKNQRFSLNVQCFRENQPFWSSDRFFQLSKAPGKIFRVSPTSFSAPKKPSSVPAQPIVKRSCPPCGGSETSTGSISHDFGALWTVLEALILASSEFSSLLARFVSGPSSSFSVGFRASWKQIWAPTGLRGLKNQ